MEFKEIKLEELNSNAWAPGGKYFNLMVATTVVAVALT